MQTQNTEEIQIDSPYDIIMMPHIEQNIPIPKNAREALPDLTNEEEVEMLANTVKLISDLTGEEIHATAEDVDEAKSVIKTMIKEPNTKIQLKKYKNATLASLAGMVAELDAQVVDELKDLKTFVVNGLIREATPADKPKERITALRAIGDIDGVDAFKKHTEVVHKNMSMDDIESRLQTLVTKLQKRLEVKDVQGEIIENDDI
jgi:ribosomal protein S20